MRRKFGTNKGITLISLIITILILLILAGITIGMLLGEDGIINQTTNAVYQDTVSSLEDSVRLAMNEARIEEKSGGDQWYEVDAQNVVELLGKYDIEDGEKYIIEKSDEDRTGFIETIKITEKSSGIQVEIVIDEKTGDITRKDREIENVIEYEQDRIKISGEVSPTTPTMGVTITITAESINGIEKIIMPDLLEELNLSNGNNFTTSVFVSKNGNYTFTAIDENGKKESIVVEVRNIETPDVTPGDPIPPENVSGLSNISIELNPTELTNQNVIVTINFDPNKSTSSGIINQYSADGGATWHTSSEASKSIEVVKNTTILGRYYYNQIGYSEVEKEVNNIDREAPEDFSLLAQGTMNEITVFGKTTDVGVAGLATYEYILKDKNGTIIQDWTASNTESYKFENLTQETEYKVSMKAVDNAGNEKEALNKDYIVMTSNVPSANENLEIIPNITTPTPGPIIVIMTTTTEFDIQYKIDDGQWQDYIGSIAVTENCVIYGRLIDKTTNQVGEHKTLNIQNITKGIIYIEGGNIGTDEIYIADPINMYREGNRITFIKPEALMEFLRGKKIEYGTFEEYLELVAEIYGVTVEELVEGELEEEIEYLEGEMYQSGQITESGKDYWKEVILYNDPGVQGNNEYLTGDIKVVMKELDSDIQSIDASEMFAKDSAGGAPREAIVTELISLDLSEFETNKITDMSKMFYGRSELNDIDVSGFDTSNVTNMSNMFAGCYGEDFIDLTGFDTQNVTDMSSMFAGCTYTDIDISGFDTTNVKNMSDMFADCRRISELDFSTMDTSNVTDMSYMFWFADIYEINIDEIETDNVTNMQAMFYNASFEEKINVSEFNTSNVTDMSYMFASCYNLEQINLSNFNTSNVTDMSSMFSGCRELTNLDVSKFDTSNVIDMSSMFSGCRELTNLDLSKFDTSNVADMSGMFSSCNMLNGLEISGFNTSNVTDMSYMFSSCNGLSSLDLSSFNTSNVADMSAMFKYCNGLSSLNLSKFNTSKVINMSYMFEGLEKITELDISNFNVSKVETFGATFAECTNLKKIDLGEFTLNENPEPKFETEKYGNQQPYSIFKGTLITDIYISGQEYEADVRKMPLPSGVTINYGQMP